MASRSSAQSLYPDSLPQFLRLGRREITTKFVELEWQQRERLAQTIQNPSQTSRWARLTGDHIANRNRYINVEPFANNRIKLPVAEGGNDYINASPIILGNRRYIATQGPKDASTAHFYRMLAAETESPAVVVMLTQTHEAGREKCFPYFPASQETPIDIALDPEFNDAFEGQVELVKSEEDPTCRCTVRTLRMRTKPAQENKEQEWEEKEVKHLLFTGWPDFAIPEGDNRQAMLDLIDLSTRLNTSQNPPATSCFTQDADDVFVEKSSKTEPSLNPRIVHCSAGVGRSGTFIALDYLLAQLREGHLDSIPAASDPIADTVERMRQQRMMMVQGESQFIFLYDVMRQAWIQRYEAIQQASAGSVDTSTAA